MHVCGRWGQAEERGALIFRYIPNQQNALLLGELSWRSMIFKSRRKERKPLEVKYTASLGGGQIRDEVFHGEGYLCDGGAWGHSLWEASWTEPSGVGSGEG